LAPGQEKFVRDWSLWGVNEDLEYIFDAAREQMATAKQVVS
jgi:hypothetical protein